MKFKRPSAGEPMGPLLRAPFVLVITLCVSASGGAAPAPAPAPADRPVARTHSHNDYEHEHPLFDALHHGFVSVEADVYLVGNELRVSHNRAADWNTVPTLQDSYLSPLRDLMKRRNNGGIYPDGTPVLLLVDIKSEAEATYARLHAVLAEYQAATPILFTTFATTGKGGYKVAPGAVTVVISGNRPREAMKRQATRYAGYDGRLSDVAAGARADDGPGFMPLVSDNWATVFTGKSAWDGTGDMPAAARVRLGQVVADVHAQGKKVRLWNLPKAAPAVWGPLYDAGVDLINTDDLAGLSKFLASRAGAGPAPGASKPRAQ
jgi:hypothetical protein